jgi:hypothetical protein
MAMNETTIVFKCSYDQMFDIKKNCLVVFSYSRGILI